MREGRPSVTVLAGPNGAGKSTAAAVLMGRTLQVVEFVNADDIAAALSPQDVDAAAITAGRIMLTRLRELASQRRSFAFETTLATRSFAPWLTSLRGSGYSVHLIYFWLSSERLAIRRVAGRVRSGGHDVPAETVRRRYNAGLRNFFNLYAPIASSWAFYDNSAQVPHLLAERLEPQPLRVYDEQTWMLVLQRGKR